MRIITSTLAFSPVCLNGISVAYNSMANVEPCTLFLLLIVFTESTLAVSKSNCLEFVNCIF